MPAALRELFVQAAGIVQQYLVSADKYQRGRQTLKVAEKGRGLRRGLIVGIAFRIETQKLFRERRIVFTVGLIRIA